MCPMRMDNIIETKVETKTKLAVETNPATSNMESWKFSLQMAKEAIQWLKQGLGSVDQDAIEGCIQTMEYLSQKGRIWFRWMKSTNEEGTHVIHKSFVVFDV